MQVATVEAKRMAVGPAGRCGTRQREMTKHRQIQKANPGPARPVGPTAALMYRFLQLLAIFAVALVAGRASSSAGAEPKLLGSLSCSATACHGSEPADSKRPLRGEEFVRWLHSDPHAKAAQTLASEKYREILLRVSGRDDGQADPQLQARCAKCHDPLGGTGDHTTISPVGHGIGCETCHGNAEHWLSRHYERDIERSELTALGLLDTKQLPMRAKQCASCHVGSADQDMNHDMIAAGHPPLRFELSAYHDLIQHKHWNDTRERLEKRDFQVQLWAAGQTASTAARLELLDARCQQSAEQWPELAEYNCFSCHQRIRGNSELAEKKAGAGRPQWSNWNLLFVDSLQPANSKQEMQTLTALQGAFSNCFPVDQDAVKPAAAAARLQLQNLSSRGFTANDVLKMLTTTFAQNTNSDWETRCQQYLALTAVERAYRDELAKRQHFARLDQTEYNRRLAAEKTLIVELQQVRTWLQFEPGALPGVPGSASKVLRDEPLQFHEHRGEVGSQLQRIADRLQARMLELP